jgi:hypothetical protein
MTGGRLSKKTVTVVLTANAIKSHLGLTLTDDEQTIGTEYLRRRSGRAS